MNEITGNIAAGDYQSAGRFSKEIKAVLKQIGVDPGIIRRAMVAAYEAEMNVVIHSHGGVLQAGVSEEALEVCITDSGPGIPDLEQALREGFSTAPDEARTLGFGAGMGLPNIRKNTDRFSIHSQAGLGTALRFTVLLRPQSMAETSDAALRCRADACCRCLRCLPACPTQAIRIQESGPAVLPHLCIGCTACIEACPNQVFSLATQPNLACPPADAALIVPPALRGQFGASIPPGLLERECMAGGYSRAVFTDVWEQALRNAVRAYADTHPDQGPWLSPVCPAAIQLVRTRYPGLLGQIPPFLSAWEAAIESVEGPIAVLGYCPALCTLVRDMRRVAPAALLTPEALFRILMPKLAQTAGRVQTPTQRTSEPVPSSEVRIAGLKQIMRFLDLAENGQANDCRIVELYACESGCHGSPLWPTPPEIARYRGSSTPDQDAACDAATAVFRPQPLSARAGLRLDADMGRAIQKLAEIDRAQAQLPGRNCAVCGAPSCQALAEDHVLGRADLHACPYLLQHHVDAIDPNQEEQS